MHDVLKEFHKITGLPILINTSFNDNNEPIVLTKLDALCCFARTNSDVLVLNDEYILRSDIKEPDKFIETCESLQKDYGDKSFTKAVLRNTNITKNTLGEKLDNFIERNLKISNFYRETYVSEKLIYFIQQRDINKKLILDEFHYDILMTLQDSVMGKIEDYFPNYEIVNDDFSCLGAIKGEVDLLLYNMSI